jgi:crotonobetainyl-CoA:carnitine CoA-transferase CaiB-like acyl-CoA transferase
VAVDLRTEEGALAVKRLARRSDVLVESFRPGTLARRGLGAAELRAENPRLIYCSVTGYGQDGPLAARAGHDIDYLALGGFLGANRDDKGDAVLPATQIADMTGGLLATIGVLAALQARERTGHGQVVDVSMLEGVLSLLTVPAARLLAGGSLENELTGTHGCYHLFRCKDGRELAVGALEPKFWGRLCEVLGRPDLAHRQWERGEEREETKALLAAAFEGKNRGEWIDKLESADACVEPVLEVGEALTQPQAVARRAVDDGRLASPLRLTATPTLTRRQPPRLGQHTAEVLVEAGFTPRELERMREGGAIP